jgi:hypothetical protein
MNIGLFDIRRSQAFGLSDDQEKAELRTQRRFEAAAAEMRKAIEDVNASSALVEIEPSAFEDFLNDECPSADYWAERVAAARRG